jgi:hypothetical protein
MKPSEPIDHISYPGSASRYPPRREFLLGMAATVAIGLTGEKVLAQERDIPGFQSGRFQFTILRPRQILRSTRRFQVNRKTVDLVSLQGKPILLNCGRHGAMLAG